MRRSLLLSTGLLLIVAMHADALAAIASSSSSPGTSTAQYRQLLRNISRLRRLRRRSSSSARTLRTLGRSPFAGTLLTADTTAPLLTGDRRIQLAQFRSTVLDLVNAERSSRGLAALTLNDELNLAAQRHAEDMRARGFFEHINPDGLKPSDRIRAAGYPLRGAWFTGENIASGQTTPEQVVQEWMGSASHSANILSENFREMGLGFEQEGDTRLWVQEFGSHSE